MESPEKIRAFADLHNLLDFYSENRDRPVEKGFDFFKEVEQNCLKLGLDYEDFKQAFHLKEGGF